MASQLAVLQEIERLSPLVIRILGGNPGKVCLSLAYEILQSDILQFTLQGSSLVRHARLNYLSNSRHQHLSHW